MSQSTFKLQTAAVLQSVWAKATINTKQELPYTAAPINIIHCATPVLLSICQSHPAPVQSVHRSPPPHLHPEVTTSHATQTSADMLGSTIPGFRCRPVHRVPACRLHCMLTAAKSSTYDVVIAVAEWWVLSYSSLLTLSCGQSVLLLTSPQ